MSEIPLVVASVRKVASGLRQAAAGDTAQVGPNKVLVIDNDPAGATRTITVNTPGTDFTGGATPNLVETVAAGEVAFIPLGNQYADQTTTPPGQAVIGYDSTPATLKVAVLALV